MTHEERFEKLSRAMDLIIEVQVGMAVEQDHVLPHERNEIWRSLYRIRVDLGNFMARLGVTP